jgi:hypothetical protein
MAQKNVVRSHANGHDCNVMHTNCTVSPSEYSCILDGVRCVCEPVSISRLHSHKYSPISNTPPASTYAAGITNELTPYVILRSDLTSESNPSCVLPLHVSRTTFYSLSIQKLRKYYFFRHLVRLSV